MWNGDDITSHYKDNSWYNISTKRYVTKPDRKDLLYLDKVCGNREDIRKFVIENKLEDKFTDIQIEEPLVIPSPKQEAIPQEHVSIFKRITRFFTRSLPQTDVESLLETDYQDMCRFTLNLSGKGKVVKTIDGDTVDILMYIPINEIAKTIPYGKKKKMTKNHIIREASGGYFAIYRCRLNGFDAAEKNTEEGQYAKAELIKYFQKYNNIVYFKLVTDPSHPDKWGREIAELFMDKSYTISCQEFMLNLRLNGKVVALPYDGGKKDDYMKNLTVI